MNLLDPIELQKRTTAAYLVVSLAFLVLAGAFFRTQIIQHEKYQLKAESNRLRPVALPPPRGAVVDRHGAVIAENLPGYTVKLLAPNADSLRAALVRLSTVVPLDTAQMSDVVRRWRNARYQPVVVFGDATFETASRLEEHRALLPGLVLQSEPRRLYPAGPAVAHLVGYVSEITDAELESGRFAGAQPGSIVGRSGIEREYDDTLRGREGVRYIEVNARGGLVREQASAASLPPIAGRPLNTTIDLDLQRYIDSIWPAGVRGAMLAVTPRGEIRALYSAPTYDPNLFVGGISGADYRALLTDAANPLINRAIYGRYPPASPFKLATAAMALRRGIVGFGSHMPVPCTGGYRLGNRVFKCWKKEGHGSLDLVGAVAKSCDVYFYQLGQKLGLEAIIQDGVLMGFRDRSGVDLPSEQEPVYPASLEYFDKRYGPRNWSPPATILNFSIGQGENTQTLVNMVKFYAALAGDGKIRAPYVVRESKAPTHDLGLTPEQLAGLRRALIAVVEQGTAAASKRKDLAVAGKTGTAQNSHGKDHGWFIGFAPAENPEIVIGAIMEFAEHGSSVAPYVVKAMRRYVLGPEAPPARPQDLVVPVDSAPRDAPADTTTPTEPAPVPTVSMSAPPTIGPTDPRTVSSPTIRPSDPPTVP
jgi:penicillin-binding protein 2